MQLRGRPDIINDGRISFGDDCAISSRPVRSHFAAMAGATIDVGDRVRISFGAAITAQRAIQIGSDTEIGSLVVIMDGDFHRTGDRDAAGDVAAIRIGSGVIIGARTTILRGADVGDGAQILSGSMVSGSVSAGTTVGGVPARAMGGGSSDESAGLPQLVAQVLGLVAPPELSWGPGEIPEWDSLGTLRLLLAIEETYGITVREEEIQAARTVAALSATVERARARS